MTQIQALIIALAFAIGAGLGFFAEHLRLGTKIAKIELAHAQAVTAAAQKTQTQETAARTLEQQLRTERDAHDNQLREILSHDQAEFDRLTAAIRLRDLRLSVPVRAIVCPGSTAADRSAADDDSQGRAELTAEAAEFLTGIAKRSDDSALMLNGCIDQYETVRAKLAAFAESVKR